MGKKRGKQEEAKADGFMTLFTALSVILVAFFILLNTMATLDEVRTQKAMESLVGTFGPLPFYLQQQENPDMEHRRRVEQMRSIAQEVESVITSQGLQAEATTDVDEDGIMSISLTDELLFESGEVFIAPLAFDLLDELAAMFVELEYTVYVEGHADPTPAQGPQSNWYFSAARASSVYRYFISQQPDLESSMWAYGFGDSRPHPEGPDRRVDLIVIPGGEDG